MPKIFISHSWEDNEVSKKLAESLKRDGTDVWIDYKRLVGGDNLPDEISKAIDWCDTMILIWSESAKESYYVKLEWTAALNNKKRIIACVLDNIKLPAILRAFLYIDFKDFEIGYQSLARDLKLIPASKTSPEEHKPVLGKEIQKVKLRSKPIENLSVSEVYNMLIERNFFDSRRNKQGKGLNHQYEAVEKEGEKLVIDHTTHLTWQQSGSLNFIRYYKAEEYIKKLNDNRFSGYDDWRLPTLEEAMSLMEIERRKGGLYISEVFDQTQEWIRTADKKKIYSSSAAWVVDFLNGGCYNSHVDASGHVRAVR